MSALDVPLMCNAAPASPVTVEEPKSLSITASAPVKVVRLDASIVPPTFPSSASSSAAVRVVFDSVTATVPRPLMPLEAKAVATCEAVPVRVVTPEASITVVTVLSSALRSAAASVVSDSVTLAVPRPVIPLEARAVATSAAKPTSAVTPEASIVPLVAASMELRSRAYRERSESVTDSSPRPVMPLEA